MASFSDFGKKLGLVTKKVSDKSSQVVENAKLNSQINRLETDIEDIQYELGKAYYEKYFMDDTCEFCEYIKRINDIVEEIRLKNDKILFHKGLRVCPSCQTLVSLENDFCGKCGTRLEYPVIDNKELWNCPSCGNPNELDATFCYHCGYCNSIERVENVDGDTDA